MLTFSEFTREERYFTSVLFHDIQHDWHPFWDILDGKLDCADDITVEDVGFEVCFFRDAARAGLIERQTKLEKQTFDLMLRLSDGSLVIIEAKAQQGFHIKQLKGLQHARKLIRESTWPSNQVFLVALYSSLYTLRPATRNYFGALVCWDAVAQAYPGNAQVYNRANDIYRK